MTTTTLDPAEDLAEALDTFGPADAEFTVDTEQKALWAARKLQHARRKIAERTEVAAAEIARIQAWADETNKRHEDSAGFFESLLENYHRTMLAADTKQKTIKLPGVTLKARAGQPAWTFDDDAFIAWAVVNEPSLLRHTTVPNKTDAKKALTVLETGIVIDASGEVVDGITVAPAETKYSLDVEIDPA